MSLGLRVHRVLLFTFHVGCSAADSYIFVHSLCCLLLPFHFGGSELIPRSTSAARS